MKTLYIQINNNSLSKRCSKEVEVLDCRCINDFCSLVGDALVGDLKDENGKPFYRLINPVGKLLMDFKAVDDKIFDSIIEDWYDILGNLLHKGIQDDDISIKFPQQYVDWLLNNANPYYEQVGKELQREQGKIALSSEAIDDDIIASLNYKVSHALQEKKEDYSFVVFSNSIIRNSSIVVKRVRLDGIEFMRYDCWMEHLAIQKLEEETAKQKSFNVNGVSFEMIRVEGGTFTMGGTPEQDEDFAENEKPVHEVTISSFYMGKYVVTQELWEAVMKSNSHSCLGNSFPVVNISWFDCQNFIEKLNAITGLLFRLPTEAEWEYAARGGVYTHNYKYSGGNIIDDVAWYYPEVEIDDFGDHLNWQLDNMRDCAYEVGLKKPNELGIYDMSGNVYEWCQDWKGAYNFSQRENPLGPLDGEYKIVRGGCWEGNPKGCRVSHRNGAKPNGRIKQLGFRLAL